MSRRVTKATLTRIRRIVALVNTDKELWDMFNDDFTDFIDATEEYIKELHLNSIHLNGSTRGDTKRGQQAKMKLRLWRERDRKCERCGRKLTWAIYRMHHVKPVAAGGTFDDDNLTMICALCHAEEHG